MLDHPARGLQIVKWLLDSSDIFSEDDYRIFTFRIVRYFINGQTKTSSVGWDSTDIQGATLKSTKLYGNRAK